jgi:Uma2 family endonuclease
MLSKMALTERDLLVVQAAYPEARLELRDGKIIVMTPSGFQSEAVVTELAARLWAWVRPRKLGFVVTSSAGFRLPNGDVIAPDVSYVAKERLRSAPRDFADVVPNLAVEVRSPSDRIADLVDKLALLRSFGAHSTLLVDPDERTVRVDAEGELHRVLTGEDTLELPAVLPGWSMLVSELWPDEL